MCVIAEKKLQLNSAILRCCNFYHWWYFNWGGPGPLGPPWLRLCLEDTFWKPWPWPRSLKSSKIALSSTRGQHKFLNCKSFVDHLKIIFEHLFLELAWKIFCSLFLRSPETFFGKPFFFRTLAPLSLASSIPVLGLERVCCPQKGCPWLGLTSLISLTPPLIMMVVEGQAYEKNIDYFRAVRVGTEVYRSWILYAIVLKPYLI